MWLNVIIEAKAMSVESSLVIYEKDVSHRSFVRTVAPRVAIRGDPYLERGIEGIGQPRVHQDRNQ